MTRYFFSIVEGDEIMDDEEGTELPNLEAARTEALESAREVIADDVLSARKYEAGRAIMVRDETGKIVLTLPFSEVWSQGG